MLRFVEITIIATGTDLGMLPSTTYLFGQTSVQREQALVAVDDDCELKLWDQYGDTKKIPRFSQLFPLNYCTFFCNRIDCQARRDDNKEERDTDKYNRSVEPSAMLVVAVPMSCFWCRSVLDNGHCTHTGQCRRNYRVKGGFMAPQKK